MKLALRRSGGFAGLALACEVESDQLPPAARAQLEGWIDQRSDLSLAEHPSAEALRTAAPGGADLFCYELEIARGDDRISVSFDDATFPEALVDLVDYLCDQLAPSAPAGE